MIELKYLFNKKENQPILLILYNMYYNLEVYVDHIRFNYILCMSLSN